MKKYKKLLKHFRISSYSLLLWLLLFILLGVLNPNFYENNKIWINFSGIAITIYGIISSRNIIRYQKEVLVRYQKEVLARHKEYDEQ